MSDTTIHRVISDIGVRSRVPAGSVLAAREALTDGFARALRGEGDGHTPDEARRASEQLVALTFVQPVLREAREASRAAPPFAPTAIEKQFGPLMDQILSERIVRSSNWAIVERIARDMQRAGAAQDVPEPAREGSGHG